MKGTIKKLLTNKGCGFIKGDDGKEYFFHHSALRNARFDELQEGQTISEFIEGKGTGGKGPRAEEIYT